MPEFSGSTDEKHVFTLPSEIERVRWLRRQAAPGGVVGLQIRTIFCAVGSAIKVKIEDAQGTVHQTLSGELPGQDVTLQVRVPEAATGGLLAKVEMPNHGLSAASEALALTKPIKLRGPRWSTETVTRGDIVTLTAEAKGAPDGQGAIVRIFERDPGQGAHDPVTQLRPRVENEAVEAKYRFHYPGDTSGITPEWEAPNGYRQPEFFYTVTVDGLSASSETAKSKGRMTFVDDLKLQVVDAKSGAPYPDQTVKLTLADGSTREKTTGEAGSLKLKEVPPGPVKATLPEIGAPDEEAGPVEEPAGVEEVVAGLSPNGPPTAQLTTGTPSQIKLVQVPFPVSA